MDIYNYTKAYLASNHPIDFGQLLQIEHGGKYYHFHIERLVYRSFGEQEYCQYMKKREICIKSYRLNYYIEGDNAVYIDGEKKTCKEGTLLLLSPGQQPSNTPKEAGAYNIITFVFYYKSEDGSYLTLPFGELLHLIHPDMSNHIPVMTLLDQEERTPFVNIMNKLYDIIHEVTSVIIPYTYHGTPVGIASRMLRLIQFLSNLGEGQVDMMPDHVYRAIHYIREHYREYLTINKLAGYLGLSKTHFQNLFKSCTGTTPIHYQHLVRLTYARLLLSETEESCGEIASKLGYSNQYYFSKKFKQLTGEGPMAFRKNSRGFQ